MNLAMPWPCIGPQRSVRRMSRSRVPCRRSSRSSAESLVVMGRKSTTLLVDNLLDAGARKMFHGPTSHSCRDDRKMFHVKHFPANLLILKSGYEGIGQATRSVIGVNRLDSTRCGGPGLRGRQPWPAALSSFFPALRYGPACSSADRSHGPAGRRRWFPCRLALLSVCGSGHPSLRSARATATVAGGTRPDLSRAEVMLRL